MTKYVGYVEYMNPISTYGFISDGLNHYFFHITDVISDEIELEDGVTFELVDNNHKHQRAVNVIVNIDKDNEKAQEE